MWVDSLWSQSTCLCRTKAWLCSCRPYYMFCQFARADFLKRTLFQKVPGIWALSRVSFCGWKDFFNYLILIEINTVKITAQYFRSIWHSRNFPCSQLYSIIFSCFLVNKLIKYKKQWLDQSKNGKQTDLKNIKQS